jgi:hypothetical protein
VDWFEVIFWTFTIRLVENHDNVVMKVITPAEIRTNYNETAQWALYLYTGLQVALSSTSKVTSAIQTHKYVSSVSRVLSGSDYVSRSCLMSCSEFCHFLFASQTDTQNDSLSNHAFRRLAVNSKLTQVTDCTPLEECWVMKCFTTATN